MYKKTTLFVAFFAFLLSGCRLYDQGGPVTSANGLSCQLYTDYGLSSWGGKRGADCTYICPDGTVRQPVISERFSASSPLYSASKADLDAQFCGMTAAQLTPTELPRSMTPTTAPSPTAQASPTSEIALTAGVSPTAGVGQVASSPLLTGEVPMCDLAAKMINFRMIQPVPDLTGRTLAVQIADLDTTCAVNPVNSSLLTCTIPLTVTFPANVVASLDGVVVNDFTFDGTGCAKIATEMPTLAR